MLKGRFSFHFGHGWSEQKITQKHIDTLLDKAHRQIICIIKVVLHSSEHFFVYDLMCVCPWLCSFCSSQSSTPLGPSLGLTSHDTNQSQMLNTETKTYIQSYCFFSGWHWLYLIMSWKKGDLIQIKHLALSLLYYCLNKRAL